MANHVRRGLITPRDLLLRESSLIDYAATHVTQPLACLQVIRLNYPVFLVRLSPWVTQLQSLRHQMDTASHLLSSAAASDGKPMLGTLMSYSSAFGICSQLLAETKADGTGYGTNLTELDLPPMDPMK